MKFPASNLFRCFQPSTATLTVDANEEDERDVPAFPNPNFRVFSYEELKAATQGFRNKIGEGAFGSVYKGRLGYNLIAVKVLSVEVDSMRGEREFISEISALSDMSHENLVTLRGCCISEAQRLLVYDYMENNSLAHTFLAVLKCLEVKFRIRPKEVVLKFLEVVLVFLIVEKGCGEQNRVKFSWTLRKRVSLGIASGLCYLHEEVNPHIVHRDIKASNILLDHDFTPKLADFGLAKLFRGSRSYISTRVAGTLGYLSPEYAHSGHLTRKSDIYSFGVLLLEIVSGRPVIDYHLQYGEQFLVEKAWELYNSENFIDLTDSALKGDFSHEEAIRFLKVGLLCVQEITRLRPSISEAIKMLKNDIDTENVEISRPGIVADLMEVRIKRKHSSNFTSSPASSSTVSFQAR